MGVVQYLRVNSPTLNKHSSTSSTIRPLLPPNHHVLKHNELFVLCLQVAKVIIVHVYIKFPCNVNEITQSKAPHKNGIKCMLS